MALFSVVITTLIVVTGVSSQFAPPDHDGGFFDSNVFRQSSSSFVQNGERVSSFKQEKSGGKRSREGPVGHSESDSMTKSQVCRQISLGEECACKERKDKEKGSECKCVAKKLRCDQKTGKCMCCERSGCHAHHEDFGADVAEDVERQVLERGVPRMMGEIFGKLDDAEDEAEDLIMASMPKFIKGQRSINMESPEKMRKRMDAEFESFFKEFENIDNVRRDKRKRRK